MTLAGAPQAIQVASNHHILMARLSILSVLLASSLLALATPLESQNALQTSMSDKWKWSDCGML